MSKRIGKYSLLTSFLFLSLVTVSFAQVPQVSHVFIVLEENTNYSDVIGNPAMPYLNSLANRYGVATNYFANTHPSIGNYFMLTAGQIVTNNDSFSSTVTVDNIVRQLLAQGKTWKAYEEDLPSAGYIAPNVAGYARKHCPLSFFSDVVNSPTEIKNLVPFTQFAQDLANNQFPNYSFISPNLCNDAHDCPLTTADTWLRNNIDPLVTSPLFQNDGILVIVFDEAGSDNTNGGGKIAWVVVSPKAKTGFKSTNLYQHQSTLRMMAEALGLTSFPGAAATAPDMAEFFGNPAPPNGSDFALSATPASQSVTQGGSASYNLSISPSGGFTGSVGLSASGLPTGATAIFSPSAATSSSTMTVTTDAAATPAGSFPVTITGISAGNSGTLTHTASVTLVVTPTPPAPGDFSLTATPASQSVVQGASTSYTMNITPSGRFNGSVNLTASGLPSGANAIFSPSSATGSSTMTVSTTAATRAGSFPVTITGTSGTLTHTASVTLVVTPTPPVPGDFSLAATPASRSVVQGASTTYTVNITPSGGFTGSAIFSASGLPTGANATFSPNPTTGSSTMNVSTGATTAAGSYTVTITGTSTGTSGTLTHTASVTLVVTPTPPGPGDFSLAATPASRSVVQGASTTYTVNITPSGGFTGSAIFSASGLPTGANATFSPNPTTGSSTMNVSTGTSTPAGSYTVTITGTSTGTSGTLTHTASATLVVTATVPAQGDFSLAATPPSQTGRPGTTAKYIVTVASAAGYTGTINLRVHGLPHGAKATFSPASMQNAGSSTLTVSLGKSVSAGKYHLTIIGHSQHLTRRTSIVLTTAGNELDDD